MVDDTFNRIEAKLILWATKQVAGLITWVSGIMLSTPLELLQSDAFNNLHNIMIKISLAFMVPILAWCGIRHIVGIDQASEVISTLTRMALVPILIKLIPWMIIMATEIFNKLSHMMTSNIKGFAPSEITNLQGAEVGILLFIVIYLYLVVRLILFYAYRNYAILALTLFSPFIVLMWAIPGGQDRLEKFKGEVISLLATQFLHSIQLVLLMGITVGIGGTSTGKTSVLLVQIGALMFMLRTPEWVESYLQLGGSIGSGSIGNISVIRTIKRVLGRNV